MAFVTLHSLPSFLTFPTAPSPRRISSLIPRLRPRQVPLTSWGSQVLVLTASSLLNNVAVSYQVPITVQIVFRSAGERHHSFRRNGMLSENECRTGSVDALWRPLPPQELYPRSDRTSIPPAPFLHVLTYFIFPRPQACVVFVTIGVIIATTSTRTSSSPPSPQSSSTSSTVNTSAFASTNAPPIDLARYTTGIVMLSASLLLTGVLGMLQERTYTRYGPCWREGLFYTVRPPYSQSSR